jgi:glyoxylase-like metal-dependent hydrolase (beta-lactamase superfamily II)
VALGDGSELIFCRDNHREPARPTRYVGIGRAVATGSRPTTLGNLSSGLAKVRKLVSSWDMRAGPGPVDSIGFTASTLGANLDSDLAAIDISGTLQKQAWDDDVLPPVENLGQGLWSVPVPMPQSSLRYVLVYLLEQPSGVTLIDAGWDTEEAWAALNAGLGKAGYAITDVRSVLVTHIHPDHYGLAGRVREASGAWIALHPADAEILPQRYMQMDGLLTTMRTHLLECGVPLEAIDSMRGASMPVRGYVNAVLPDVLLEDGDQPEVPGWQLTAVWTPGHSPGHLCFYDAERRLLMSGDHILPRITPNISVHPQQTSNPLADFLDALERVAGLEVDEVLPAHEYRFRNLAQRIVQLRDHHEHRLSEVVAVLAAQPGATAWEITVEMTWSRPWDEIQFWMRRAALGETLAHLIVLESRGVIRRTREIPQRWELTGSS